MGQIESAGGNYGIGTRELQQTQYLEGTGLERQRREDFQDALELFRAKDFEGALIAIENVKASEPANYISDTFSRVTDIYQIAAYNVACAYAALGQIEGARSARGLLGVGLRRLLQREEGPEPRAPAGERGGVQGAYQQVRRAHLQ